MKRMKPGSFKSSSMKAASASDISRRRSRSVSMTLKCEAPPPSSELKVHGHDNPRVPQPKDNLFATNEGRAGHMMALLFPSDLASFCSSLNSAQHPAI